MIKQVKLTFAFLIIVLFLPQTTTYGHDQVTTFVGDIVGTVYLENRVNIISTVTVTKGATLKIKPGSSLVFLNPQARLIVYGNIQALGDKGEPVYFESPLPGTSFAGIVLKNSGKKKNVFKYCRFRRARVALSVEDSQVFIWQCRFMLNEETMRIKGTASRLVAKENLFSDNRVNWPLIDDVKAEEVKFLNNFWSNESIDAENNQAYNSLGIVFSPAAADPTNWTAR